LLGKDVLLTQGKAAIEHRDYDLAIARFSMRRAGIRAVLGTNK
jgi:hypothetical protein